MTRTGNAALCLAVVLIAAAVALGSPDIAFMAVLVAVPVAASWMWLRKPPALHCERQVTPPHVERGQSARAIVSIRNDGSLPAGARRAVDHIDSRAVSFAIERLASGQQSVIEYDLPTNRRGVIAIGPIELVRSDPFGFVRRTQQLGEMAELTVCPRVLPMAVPGRGRRRSADGATSRQALYGNSVFHAIREYSLGDDRRSVHWKSTARTGTLMVKQNVDPTQPEALIVLDVEARPGTAAAFEEAVDVAASLAVAVLECDCPVRVLTSAGQSWQFAPGSGPGPILSALSSVTAVPADELSDVAPLAARDAGSVAAIITASEPVAWAPLSAQLSARFGTVATFSLRAAASPALYSESGSGTSLLEASDASSAIDAWNRGIGA